MEKNRVSGVLPIKAFPILSWTQAEPSRTRCHKQFKINFRIIVNFIYFILYTEKIVFPVRYP